ncbi:hypothetical protein SAMN05421504_108349 [Amycolatopsis xylanica]|uniref:HEAT repeat-containing protein n=1 Tax=Amycolatopsis xylanica TaxID=589385 RepID=A0A1H3PQI3_9PSEU|nr:hypothetical protein [Amycolatopsis xylanica]SDZ03220.1 hypothetical protein SAMN05421504_108349 [Amycolatopsis xylanica]
MTLRADLTALLAGAGIADVDIDEAVADEHVRSAAYQRVVSAVADSQDRAGDRAIVATILRDPEELTAKTAIVALVDEIARKATDPVSFQRWAAAVLPELDRLEAEGHREFIRQRIRDWLFYLSVEDGQVPTPEELAEVTDWMQRLLAEESTSAPVLGLLAESGRTKKIRNIAKNRVR